MQQLHKCTPNQLQHQQKYQSMKQKQKWEHHVPADAKRRILLRWLRTIELFYVFYSSILFVLFLLKIISCLSDSLQNLKSRLLFSFAIFVLSIFVTLFIVFRGENWYNFANSCKHVLYIRNTMKPTYYRLSRLYAKLVASDWLVFAFVSYDEGYAQFQKNQITQLYFCQKTKKCHEFLYFVCHQDLFHMLHFLFQVNYLLSKLY